MKKKLFTWNFRHFSLNKFPITLAITLIFSFFFASKSSAWEVDIRDKNSMPQGLVVVDKTQKRLRYLEKHSPLIMLHEYPSIHGENEGDKMMEGDLKTPEGVYFITTKIKMELDFDEYGSQAHALNYPNPVDRLRGKTGGGIWIHSKGSPIKDQTTQGCIAIDIDNIEELGTHLSSGTPVLIAQSVTQDAIMQDGGVSAPINNTSLPTSEKNSQSEQNIDTIQDKTNTSNLVDNSFTFSENSEGFLQSLFASAQKSESKSEGLINEQMREQLTYEEMFAQEELVALADSDIESQNEVSIDLFNTNARLETSQENRQIRRHEKIPTEFEKAMQADIEAQIAADIKAQQSGNLPQLQTKESIGSLSSEQITANQTIKNDEQTIVKLTQEWNNAWADRSYAFFNFYDKNAYTKAQGQPFSKFYEQKDYLFRNMSWLFISYQDINALEGPGYWVTWFPQYYRAPNHKTEGIRRLYWQKDENNEYKIVAMEWLPRNLNLDKEFTKHVENTVPHFVEAWRLAWKEADKNTYESFYAIDAQQDALKGIAPIMEKKNSIWAHKKPTEIVFSNMRIDDRSNAVHVYMNQAYSDSSGYRDYGVKRLVLHPRGSSWVIAQETWSRR